MGLEHNDLQDTVLHQISIDEFEPKTGESADIVVVGMRLIDDLPARDLYRFLNSSKFNELIRDVDVSPNPDSSGHYYVFIEIARTEESLELIRGIIKDIENISTGLKWTASTHLTNDHFPLDSEELEKYFISDPAQYMSRAEWEETMGQEMDNEENEIADAEAEVAKFEESVYSFLQSASLNKAQLTEGNILELTSGNTSANLRVLAIGQSDAILKEFDLTSLPVSADTFNIRRFANMVAPLQVTELNEYIIIGDISGEQIILAEKC